MSEELQIVMFSAATILGLACLYVAWKFDKEASDDSCAPPRGLPIAFAMCICVVFFVIAICSGAGGKTLADNLQRSRPGHQQEQE